MAQDLLPAWRKVLDRTLREAEPTAAEHDLLQRMTHVFETHSAHALSMTQGMA